MINLITEHIDIWTAAQTPKANGGRGRVSSANGQSHGIKKLRELILELAVRGKLVPQDPNDEPAIVLLEKIAKEKKQLIKDGKIKKQKPLPEINEDEKPFDLPVGWEWTQLGNLSANIHYGYTASADHNNSGIRLLRITDIQNDSVNWETVPGCEIEKTKANDYLLENNDILIARTGGTIGKSYLVENINIKAVFASYLIRVKRIEGMYAPFIKTYLGSQLYWQQLYENSMGTGQPNVNATALKGLAFPIPPLAEQHRIVAKVDELMAICDQLEQQQTDSIATHQTLVETLLSDLVRPQPTLRPFDERSPEHVLRQAQDERSKAVILEKDQSAPVRGELVEPQIAKHFDTLFTTEHSIDQLKQTILQLAVMGKLVPQDPDDEPASILLEKISKEKKHLIKDGKIKKEKPLPEITDDEKPFALPVGWEWVRLQQIIKISSGDGLTAANMNSDGKIPVFGGNGITGYHDQANVTKPTLVIGRVGYYCGSIHITPKSAWITDNAFETTFSEENIYINFLSWLLKGTNLKENENATAQPVISGQKVYPIVVGLPPTAEQHRIVAKVDELMAICDDLKARLNAAQATQIQLADAIVDRAIM